MVRTCSDNGLRRTRIEDVDNINIRTCSDNGLRRTRIEDVDKINQAGRWGCGRIQNTYRRLRKIPDQRILPEAQTSVIEKGGTVPTLDSKRIT